LVHAKTRYYYFTNYTRNTLLLKAFYKQQK